MQRGTKWFSTCFSLKLCFYTGEHLARSYKMSQCYLFGTVWWFPNSVPPNFVILFATLSCTLCARPILETFLESQFWVCIWLVLRSIYVTLYSDRYIRLRFLWSSTHKGRQEGFLKWCCYHHTQKTAVYFPFFFYKPTIFCKSERADTLHYTGNIH